MIEDDLARKKAKEAEKAKEKEKRKSPKPQRRALADASAAAERLPRHTSPKHEPKTAAAPAHGKKGWSTKHQARDDGVPM